MAIKKEIVINAETEKAQKDVEKLTESVDDLGKEVKQTEKTTGGLNKGFKAIGTTLKALGIGLIIAAVAKLTEAFSKNQRILDTVSNVLNTVNVVFSEVTDALFRVYDAVSGNNESFDAMGRIVKNLITIALTPLKVTFNVLKLALLQTQLAWEESFFGDEDKATIKDLNERINETKDTLIELGKEAVKSGKAIVTDFSEAFDEVKNLGNTVVGEFSKIDVADAKRRAERLTELKNNAELAVAQQQLLIEKYDQQAERLRQIRDDDTKTIEQRQKANEELALVLNEQEKAMLSQAGAQVALANANLSVNNSIENQVALTDALANKQGVLAQIEGFRSEQLVNRTALLKEQQELENTIADANRERQLDQLQFEAENETDPLAKLEKQRQALNLENQFLIDDIERKREIYAKGTQARVDAEQEFLNAKQELSQQAILLDNKENEIKAKNKEQDLAREKLLAQQKEQLISTVSSNIIGILGENTAASKAIGIAEALINTYKGISNVWAEKSEAGLVGAGLAQRLATTAIVASQGFATVKKIASTKIPSFSGGASGGGASGVGGESAPSFNVVGQGGVNQIAETLNQQQEPIEAYVVASNVTSAQAINQNIIETATI